MSFKKQKKPQKTCSYSSPRRAHGPWRGLAACGSVGGCRQRDGCLLLTCLARHRIIVWERQVWHEQLFFVLFPCCTGWSDWFTLCTLLSVSWGHPARHDLDNLDERLHHVEWRSEWRCAFDISLLPQINDWVRCFDIQVRVFAAWFLLFNKAIFHLASLYQFHEFCTFLLWWSVPVGTRTSCSEPWCTPPSWLPSPPPTPLHRSTPPFFWLQMLPLVKLVFSVEDFWSCQMFR